MLRFCVILIIKYNIEENIKFQYKNERNYEKTTNYFF